MIFGVVFLICGVAFKVSAAPFHMWTPDVYEGAPTPVVAFIAAAPKLAAMVLFARVLLQGFPDAIEQWRQVILVHLLSSPSPSARLAGLVQTNLKRLLAYSSIANIGYALIGLATGGESGVQAMLVFMVLYMIDVTGLLRPAWSPCRGHGRPIEKLADFAGLAKERPGLALAHDRPQLFGDGHPAVLRLLGQVLRLQGGARGRIPGAHRSRRVRARGLAWSPPTITCA